MFRISGINFDGINNKIITNGEVVTIKTFSGTTPSYTADQVPIFQYSTGTTYSLILDPSRFDVNSSGGLITSSTKKFVFEKDTTIRNNDEIIYGSGTFKCIEIQSRITRTVAFGNRYGNS